MDIGLDYIIVPGVGFKNWLRKKPLKRLIQNFRECATAVALTVMELILPLFSFEFQRLLQRTWNNSIK